MNISIAERRQIENEMIFRRINEKVGDDIDALDAMHVEEGNEHLMWDELIQLRFKCECSDENCDARISLGLKTYQKIHEDRDAFIVKLNHQVDPIEKVIKTEDSYNVVRKNNSTPEPDDNLKKTNIDNS
jgi:thermostable 8-oxoguanine DNA glycosylase